MVPSLRDISDPKEYSAALSKLAESMKRTEASRQQLMWQRKVLAAQNEVGLLVLCEEGRGDLSIICFADDLRLCALSFCHPSRNSRGCSSNSRAVNRCSSLSTSRTS